MLGVAVYPELHPQIPWRPSIGVLYREPGESRTVTVTCAEEGTGKSYILRPLKDLVECPSLLCLQEAFNFRGIDIDINNI